MAVSPSWSLGCTPGSPVLLEAADGPGRGLPALEEGEGTWQCLLLTLCSPIESPDGTGEQKESIPPEHPAAPQTPPSTPVKLEEGELGGRGECMALCSLASMGIGVGQLGVFVEGERLCGSS